MRQELQKIYDMANTLAARGENISRYDLGNPDGEVLAEAKKCVQNGGGDDTSYRYQGMLGLPSLLEAVCERVTKKWELPTPLDPKRNAMVSRGGSKVLFRLFAHMLLRPGDEAVVPETGYAIHYDAIRKAYAKARTYKCGPGVDVLQEIRMAMARAKNPKLIIINSPHNPTTFTADLNFYMGVRDIVSSVEGLWVLNDMAYADLVLRGPRTTSILEVPGSEKWAVETWSMTKGHNMANTAGFALGNSQLVHRVANEQTDLGYGQFMPLQCASEVALRYGEGIVLANCERYRERDDVFTEGLNSIGLKVEPTQTAFYKWVRVPAGYTAPILCWKFLLEAGVASFPSQGFTNPPDTGEDASEAEQFIRFSLLVPKERIPQDIERMGKVLRGLR